MDVEIIHIAHLVRHKIVPLFRRCNTSDVVGIRDLRLRLQPQHVVLQMVHAQTFHADIVFNHPDAPRTVHEQARQIVVV